MSKNSGAPGQYQGAGAGIHGATGARGRNFDLAPGDDGGGSGGINIGGAGGGGGVIRDPNQNQPNGGPPSTPEPAGQGSGPKSWGSPPSSNDYDPDRYHVQGIPTGTPPQDPFYRTRPSFRVGPFQYQGPNQADNNRDRWPATEQLDGSIFGPTLDAYRKKMSGVPSAPTEGGPASPSAVAEAQGRANQGAVNQQTNSNRPTINTPFGSQNWTQDANGNWTMNNSLAPGMQGAANNLQQQMSDAFSKPFDDGSAARDQAINAAYGQSTKRLDPRFAQEQEQLGSQLAQQGLDPNSQAYRTAMQQESNSRNDAYGSAMNSAIGQGTAAQQAVFNQNMQARNMPLQELQAMQGFSNNMPGFNAAGQAQPTPYMQALQLQYGQNAANNANTGQLIGAGAGLAGSLGGAAINHNWSGNGTPTSTPSTDNSGVGVDSGNTYSDPGSMPSDPGGGEYTLRSRLRPFALGRNTNWSQQ